MDVDLLKTFLEIHKTRHFGQAADNLFLTQSAVSARIKQLEEELDVKLFIRERNNIRPTEAGEKLVRYAEDVLMTWNRAKTNISADSNKRTSVSIGAVSSLWDIYLNRWLIKFTDKFKDLMLNGQVLTEDVIQQKILNQTLDFGFTYNSPREDEGINILKKLPIKFVMVSSQADLNVSDAIKDNYLFVDWGTSFLQAHSQHFSEMPAPLMRIDVGRIAKRYIKSRTGTAYLPETIVKRDLEMGVLFKVKQAPVIRRSAYIIYNGENGRANTMARKLISQ